MCGEKLRCAKWTPCTKGSPPRVRGKELVHGDRFATQRITPACAGKSCFGVVRPAFRRDHPRVCGEKCRAPSRRCCTLGSPPRVRGKVLRRSYRDFDPRITPACAGKSPAAEPERSGSRDHPRVCGEKLISGWMMTGIRGSPPRVRGKALRGCFRYWVDWDHPRVCGEKHLYHLTVASDIGSPPRVRGKEPHAGFFER